MEKELLQLAQRLMDYSTAIVEGKILACKKHIHACQRFLNDLEKAQTEDFPYEFDIYEVYRVNEWAKLFKHAKPLKEMDDLRIHLVDFQLFLVANIFAWKHKETGYRRFKKSYIQMARKQAKSQLLAIITSYEAFNSGDKAECYIAGWGREQSNFVFKEIETQLKNCSFLEGKWNNAYHRITHLKSGSTILPLSRDNKTLDGTNPSFCVLDELHVHKDGSIYNVLESGMVRANAHICVITTAGFDLHSFCYDMYQYVSRIIDPNDTSIVNEEYFVFIAELEENDDIKDMNVLIKANPLLASFKEGLDILKGKMQMGIDMGGDKLRDYITKNCNRWIQMRKSGFLPLDKWQKCYEDFTVEDFRGYQTIVGIDLSSKVDLTSVTFLFVKEDNIYIHNHSFIPLDTMQKKMKTDRTHYDQYEQQGFLTAIDGNVVDYRYVEKYILDLEKKYDLRITEICIDAWNDPYLITSLSELGYVTVEVRQGYGTLSLPTKNFRDKVYDKKIKHNGNELFTWSIGNGILKEDINKNVMLDKSKSSDRIDPIASCINAMVRIPTLEGESIDYNEHILSDDWSF